MRNKAFIMVNIILLLTISSCKKELFVEDGQVAGGLASHNNGYPAEYDIVFNDDEVQKLVIEFSESEWEAMQEDLISIVGVSSTGGGGGPGGGGGGGGAPTFSDEDPSYFSADIHFNGLTWEHVGVRYKGNSSLNASSGKLPLRFNFDEFEYEYEGISNQRFYGFKELSLSSNYNDASLIREKSAAELFRDFGVPAVQTAFFAIYIDSGNGEEYYGVYTLCEVVFDTFLDDYFGSSSGNCYKPEDDGASFAESGFTLDGFELKTNEGIGDKSDITEMYNYLHANTRTTDPELWRANLETVFDVDGFLKYLAVNNTIQNWDTYGNMPHNYYLYHDPADGLIKWIVWDNNEAFQSGGQSETLSFTMNEVNDDWPLISYLTDDDVYYLQYKEHVKSFIETSFATSRMSGIYSDKQSLLQEYADAERTGYSYVNGQFNSAISTMISHNSGRVSIATSFVQ